MPGMKQISKLTQPEKKGHAQTPWSSLQCSPTNDSRACLWGDEHWDHLKQPVMIWLAQSRAEWGEAEKGLYSADIATVAVCEIDDESFIKLWGGSEGKWNVAAAERAPVLARELARSTVGLSIQSKALLFFPLNSSNRKCFFLLFCNKLRKTSEFLKKKIIKLSHVKCTSW